jgi:S-adenosylmethionine/arginine decarboxylase-like enzyme
MEDCIYKRYYAHNYSLTNDVADIKKLIEETIYTVEQTILKARSFCNT